MNNEPDNNKGNNDKQATWTIRTKMHGIVTTQAGLMARKTARTTTLSPEPDSSALVEPRKSRKADT